MKITKKCYKSNNNESYEDSNDIIENDEYVGDYFQNKNKLISYNKNLYSDIKYKKELKHGDIIEEKNNYIFYASGIRYNNIKNEEKNNLDNKSIFIPINSNINKKDYISQNKKYQNSLKEQNFENLNSEEEKYYSENNDIDTYNNISCFNFKDAGILRDSFNGKLFKIYKAIPLDINNKNIELDLSKVKKFNNHKIVYGNKNNFLINSCDINKNDKRNKENENEKIMNKNNHELFEKIKADNNNNYIEISECSS